MTYTILFWLMVYLAVGYLIALVGALLAPVVDAEADRREFSPQRICLIVFLWGPFGLWLGWQLICAPILLIRNSRLNRVKRVT